MQGKFTSFLIVYHLLLKLPRPDLWRWLRPISFLWGTRCVKVFARYIYLFTTNRRNNVYRNRLPCISICWDEEGLPFTSRTAGDDWLAYSQATPCWWLLWSYWERRWQLLLLLVCCGTKSEKFERFHLLSPPNKLFTDTRGPRTCWSAGPCEIHRCLSVQIWWHC